MPTKRFSASVRRTRRAGLGLEETLDLSARGETVPALWLRPSHARQVPAVLLLHGFSSAKERMSQSVGHALLAKGVASLSLDLPYHGERNRSDQSIPRNPLALVGAWRSAVSEVGAAVDWLAARDDVDAGRLGIVGYSLGGFLALMAAADDRRLGAVVLAAAGDLPDHTPYAALVRGLVDPPSAARKLAGRPLLLVNGRRDTTTRPAQAERLFAAAAEPKTLRWYDGGHWPPPPVIAEAAAWLAERLVGRAGR